MLKPITAVREVKELLREEISKPDEGEAPSNRICRVLCRFQRVKSRLNFLRLRRPCLRRPNSAIEWVLRSLGMQHFQLFHRSLIQLSSLIIAGKDPSMCAKFPFLYHPLYDPMALLVARADTC